MPELLRAVAAFITCFGAGAALHYFIGRAPRTWLLPTLVTSTIVAVFAYFSAP
jgi:hypothetical protein